MLRLRVPEQRRGCALGTHGRPLLRLAGARPGAGLSRLFSWGVRERAVGADGLVHHGERVGSEHVLAGDRGQQHPITCPQAAAARKRFGESIGVHVAPLEMFETESRYDAVFFQESSQYIDAEALFARAKTLTKNVIVLDEFALRPIDEPGALHSRDAFLAAAARHGFAVIEELDLSAKAAPTMAYFTDRIPQYRQRLMRDLGLTDADIDHLVENGVRYRERYANGTYGYRLIRLRRG